MKKISRQKFDSLIKKRELEDPKKIKIFEKMLKDERGYVFKMPKRGSNVILMVSGGLDSIVMWGILMKEYGLNVYPVTFDLGEKRRKREMDSLKYFDKFYKKKFPKHYRKFINIDLRQKKISIKIEDGTKYLTEKTILDNFKNGEFVFNPSVKLFSTLPFFARNYAIYLNSTLDLNINSIFCAVNAGDGEAVSAQSLTSLRSIMNSMCVVKNNSFWQFSSIFLEPEIGAFINKPEIISWGEKNDLPLEKTWSCYYGERYQCGGSNCLTCYVRRNSFLEAGVIDKTIYKNLSTQGFNLKRIKNSINYRKKKYQIFKIF